ncbi:hypothetical protein C8F04DRAFT_1087509 [Mycena alexandri]|uniref:Secreted protein n=1 Tax=Mycena alexandri TaxID=1745969 RepID=A0AAD6T4C5_9AGAR|nr:hypothetical protein C8F04DRAFT_1087509 [Mycena alexandri]
MCSLLLYISFLSMTRTWIIGVAASNCSQELRAGPDQTSRGTSRAVSAHAAIFIVWQPVPGKCTLLDSAGVATTPLNEVPSAKALNARRVTANSLVPPDIRVPLRIPKIPKRRRCWALSMQRVFARHAVPRKGARSKFQEFSSPPVHESLGVAVTGRKAKDETRSEESQRQRGHFQIL